MLFKQGSCADELINSMQSSLSESNYKSAAFNQVAQAVNLLNKAAEIFEQNNMSEESFDIVNIIQSLTQDIS